MKIDNPYHNPFCDHKTHRDHTATHHIFCHKEYTPLPRYFSLFLTSPRHCRIFAIEIAKILTLGILKTSFSLHSLNRIIASDKTRCWPAQAVNNLRAREL